MATGPSVSVSPNAGLASGQVDVWDATTTTPSVLVGPTITIGPSAEVASGTGWASQGDGASLDVSAENAAASGAAYQATTSGPAPFISAPAELASGTGAAYDVSTTTSAATSASAEAASGTGAATNPGASIYVYAGLALGFGEAFGNIAPATTDADPALGTGHAYNPTIRAVVIAPGVLTGVPFANLFIEILSNETTNFGPTDAHGRTGATARARRVIHDARNIGWSWYSRFPSNAFFTLPQDSIHNLDLHPGLDHVRIWYANESTGYGPILVFNGRLGDPSESGDDVVWTAWSYLAELSLSRTGYNILYKHKLIGDIVENEWHGTQAPITGTAKYPSAADPGPYGARNKTGSLLGHVTTGTIQTPRNSTNGYDVRTDAQFGVMDVPRLLLFFDLTEMGRANTTQNTVMEISRSTTPTFNFWKDKGSALTGQQLMFPGNVLDFRYTPGVMGIRNDLATIGTKHSRATEIVERLSSGTYGYTNFGRRQDTFPIKTLAGYGHIDDEATGKFKAQTQITKSAVRQSTQLTKQIQVDIRPDTLEPFQGWDIEDTIVAELRRGRTRLNSAYRIIGIRAMQDHLGFRHSLILTLPTT